MTDDPNLFKMDRVECEKCGAVWLNGQHYWSGTGALGNDYDLAGLVCNEHGNEKCINPAKGSEASKLYGDSWAKRMETITEGYDDKHAEMTERFRGKGTSLDDL